LSQKVTSNDREGLNAEKRGEIAPGSAGEVGTEVDDPRRGKAEMYWKKRHASGSWWEKGKEYVG